MFRFALSAMALVGMLATALPAFANPLAAPASDHAQAAAPATEQPPPPATAQSASSDVTVPAKAELGNNIIPVGFGWG